MDCIKYNLYKMNIECLICYDETNVNSIYKTNCCGRKFCISCMNKWTIMSKL